MRQYRTLNWLKGGRQDPTSQGSINRAEAIRAWAIQAQEQLKERWAQITHEDHEMVSRLEIRLPNGLIVAVEGDPDRSWRQKPEPESVMMAKLRAAISSTDWGAVVALYGKAPAPVSAETLDLTPAQARVAQEQMQAAAPRKPRAAPAQPATPSTGQTLLGGLGGGMPQPA